MAAVGSSEPCPEVAMTWEQAEEKSKPVLRCPLCEGRGFDTEEARLSSEATSRREARSARRRAIENVLLRDGLMVIKGAM